MMQQRGRAIPLQGKNATTAKVGQSRAGKKTLLPQTAFTIAAAGGRKEGNSQRRRQCLLLFPERAECGTHFEERSLALHFSTSRIAQRDCHDFPSAVSESPSISDEGEDEEGKESARNFHESYLLEQLLSASGNL